MPGIMGRPTKLDQVLRRNDRGDDVTVAEHVVAAIGAGNYTEQAAASAGVDKTTVYDWLKQGARISTDYHQGRRPMPRAGSRDRQMMDFSHAVAQAEAQWEVQANATLERLSRDRPVVETRTTTEQVGDGGEVVTKTVTVRKVAEADSATIRWRMERKAPSRYGHQVDVTGILGVGPLPDSVKEQAEKVLGAAATRLAENVAAQLDAQEAGPEPQT